MSSFTRVSHELIEVLQDHPGLSVRVGHELVEVLQDAPTRSPSTPTGAGISHALAEVLTDISGNARVSHELVEVLQDHPGLSARISQHLVETLQDAPTRSPTTPTGVGVTHAAVEVLMDIPGSGERFSLSAVILRLDTPQSFALEAEISGPHFRIDATIHRNIEGSFALNAWMAGIFGVNAVLSVTRLRSVILRATVGLYVQDQFMLEARILRQWITLDAVIAPGGVITLDAVIDRELTGSFPVDAWLFDGTTRQRLFTLDALLRRRIEAGFVVNAALVEAFTSVSGFAFVDALCLESFTSSFPLDAVVHDGVETGSFLIAADILGASEQRGTLTLNAVYRQGGGDLFSLDATITQIRPVLIEAWIAGAIWADAVITTAAPRTFSLSSWVAGGIALDAVIQGASSFMLDAVIQASGGEWRPTASFPLDALVVGPATGAYPIWLSATIAGQGGQGFTIEAWMATGFTLNAYVQPYFRIDAYIQSNNFVIWPEGGGPAEDPDGVPLPAWYKASRKYRVSITVDGDDITEDVIWSRASFTQNAKTNPGTFELPLKGAHPYVGGEEVHVTLDDYRTFGGIVLTVERGYEFASSPTPVTLLLGADYNILFDKLIVYNRASADDSSGSYTPYKAFSKGSLDTKIINKVFRSYVDLPAGFDYTSHVESVGVAAPEKPWAMPTSGSPLRQVMQSISQVTNAVWWISPYKALHYGSRSDITAPFPITDGRGGISSQHISMSEDISLLVTDAFLWGTLAYTTEGEIMVGREKSSNFGTLGIWQYGEFRSDLHHQAYVDRRINSVIERYGHPIHKAKVVIFEPGYQAGQVADVRLTEHGLSELLVIRSMQMTFAVSKGPSNGNWYAVPRYELSIGLDPEEPWDIYDYLPFPDWRPEGGDGWVRCQYCQDDCYDIVVPAPPDCIYLFDGFERTVASGWGSTDAGQLAWSGPFYKNNPTTTVSVDGSAGVVAYPSGGGMAMMQTWLAVEGAFTLTSRVSGWTGGTNEAINFGFGGTAGEFPVIWAGFNNYTNDENTWDAMLGAGGTFYDAYPYIGPGMDGTMMLKWEYIPGVAHHIKVWADGTDEPAEWQFEWPGPLTALVDLAYWGYVYFSVELQNVTKQIDSIAFDYVGMPCTPGTVTPAGGWTLQDVIYGYFSATEDGWHIASDLDFTGADGPIQYEDYYYPTSYYEPAFAGMGSIFVRVKFSHIGGNDGNDNWNYNRIRIRNGVGGADQYDVRIVAGISSESGISFAYESTGPMFYAKTNWVVNTWYTLEILQPGTGYQKARIWADGEAVPDWQIQNVYNGYDQSPWKFPWVYRSPEEAPNDTGGTFLIDVQIGYDYLTTVTADVSFPWFVGWLSKPAPEAPPDCGDDEGETFGAVTQGWGCETLNVSVGGVFTLTGRASRGTLTLYDADTGEFITSWYEVTDGKTFRIDTDHDRVIACYRNYVPQIGATPSVPRVTTGSRGRHIPL